MRRRRRQLDAPAETARPARPLQPRVPALPVCLLWRHPFVASTFRARLEGGPFLVTDERVARVFTGEDEGGLAGAVPVVVVESEDGSALPVLVKLGHLAPAARTIVLSESFEDEESSFRLLKSGVKGLMTYREMSERLPGVLETVAGGGFWVPRALLSRFVEVALETTPRLRADPAFSLTRRESEILEDLLQNLSNKEIAARRNLTSRTIKFHVSNVLAKYGVKRRADLLLLSLPRP